MKSIKKYLIILAILIVVGFVFYNKVYIPKTTYETISATKGSIDVEIFGIGNVGAKNIYSINAQTGGKILKLFTDEGEWVKKGDLLATIDSVELPKLLDESKISVEKSKSELIASQKELESLNAQKVLAKLTYDRYSKLKKQSFASQSEYDKAKADLDVIEAQIKVTNARIKSANIEIVRSQKGVESLEVKLSRFKVYAPVDGYVILKLVEVAQTLTPSQTIFEIVDPKTVWIKAYIDEKLSGSIKVGQNAKIMLRSQRDVKYKGVVKRIVAKSDAVTQEREVDVAFENLPIPFYIEEQAEVLIATKHLDNVIKVPSNVVKYKNGNPCLWIKKDSKATCKSVEIIAKTQDEVAVNNFDMNVEILITNPKKKPLTEGMSIH